MAKEMSTSVLLIAAFMSLVIGISLLAVVSSEILTRTTLTEVAGETVTITGWIDDLDINESVTYTLANAYDANTWYTYDDDCDFVVRGYGNSSNQSWVADADYNITDAGVLTVLNTTTTTRIDPADNATQITYQYCPETYLTESWSRTVVNIVAGFFAIALLLIAVGIFYAILKKEGLAGI